MDLYHNQLELIRGASLSAEEDKWIWVEDGDGIFSVKSCYNLLSRLVTPKTALSSLDSFVLKNIWKCSAPSKVCAFAWQTILHKIPSRINLYRRGMRSSIGWVFRIFLLQTF
jgi:hypothetical protein